MKRLLKQPLISSILGSVIWAYMALCGRTIRWTVKGEPFARAGWQRPEGLLVASWHATILTLPTGWTQHMRRWPVRRAPSAMLISRSESGEPVARAIRHLGLQSIRGSAVHKRKNKHKGGQAAIGAAARLLRSGGALCVTPDGPRGPRRMAGRGPALMAKRAGAHILPYALATHPAHKLNTWDRFEIPFPFSRGAIVFGKPIETGKGRSAEDITKDLQMALDAATDQAERLCGRTEHT